MTSAERWIRRRLRSAPEALLEAMIQALPEGELPVPEALAEGAVNLYSSVLSGSGKREDALPLLAADALFTHAFQAQADADPSGLPGFALRWGARGRLIEVVG